MKATPCESGSEYFRAATGQRKLVLKFTISFPVDGEEMIEQIDGLKPASVPAWARERSRVATLLASGDWDLRITYFG